MLLEFLILLIILGGIIACHFWQMYLDVGFRKKLWDAYKVLKIQTEHLLRIVPKPTDMISATINSDEYLTAEQVASMLQVSKATVYTWADTGYLPAIKIQGQSRKAIWRFSRKEIEDWIEKKKQPVTRTEELFEKKENKNENT